jgi:hypothetical protein
MDFFRELNPHGKVPVITHDGHTIFESGAILFYLAEKFNDLLPLPTDKENSQKRYSSIAWFQWGSAEFSRDVKELGYYYKYCKKQEPFPLVSRYFHLTHRCANFTLLIHPSIYSLMHSISSPQATVLRESEAPPGCPGGAAGITSQYVPARRALYRRFALLHSRSGHLALAVGSS